MATGLLANSIRIIADQEDEQDDALIDMSISMRICDVHPISKEWLTDTDEELISVGGRWSKRRKSWIGDATESRVVRIPRGSDQEAPARWVAEWCKRFSQGGKGPQWDDFERAWTLMLVGGRRGGKSFLAVLMLCIVAVMVRGSIIWAISPTQEETDELEAAALAFLPRHWFRIKANKGKAFQMIFPNGSRIMMLSGFKPGNLKRGRVDVALYNEAQNMQQLGWQQLRGAIADRGGLVVLACNPPNKPIGIWVEELYEKIKAKEVAAAVYEMTAESNPFVDFNSLADMRREVDEKSYRREVLGLFEPIGDVVFHAFSAAAMIEDVPSHWIDITADLTRKTLGRASRFVVGMDFQRTPHMVAVVYRFYRDPHEPDNTRAVVVDEFIIGDADEHDLVNALEAAGYRGWVEPTDTEREPGHCAIVMDASARWQDGAHNAGRTSDLVLKSRRWTHLHNPQKDSDKNPFILERCKVTNARLKAADGIRRMFILRRCKGSIKAMRNWDIKAQTPNRTSEFAHVCDGLSYVIYRFYGRPVIHSKVEYKSVNTFSRKSMMR